MDLSFGARLRLQRERQQVALATIAEQTKIKVSLLEGLERDDVSRWPGGIFRRSYVRAYAHAIGLEPDAVVREFQALFPDPDEETLAADVLGDASGRPPTRLRYLISSAIGALPARRPQPGHRNGAVGGSSASVERRTGVDGPEEMSEPPPRPAAAPVAVAEEAERELPRPDLMAIAHLCTRLGCAADAREVAAVLEEASRMLGAAGLILWTWDPAGGALRPVLSHGYSEDLLARLPCVRRDGDNALASAFRSAETRIVDGGEQATGGLAVPLMTQGGCAGVLALELRNRDERHEWVHAVAALLAAQLSTVVGHAPLVRAVNS